MKYEMNSNDRRSLAWLIWYEKSMIGRRTNTALTMSFATVVGESGIPPSRLRRARRTCTGRRSSRAHTGTYTRTWGIGGNVGTPERVGVHSANLDCKCAQRYGTNSYTQQKTKM